MRSGLVGIIGRPNVGKSTLLNSIIGEKVAITSSKAQTTRNAIRGIYNEDGMQIVFIDTPGIHKPKNALGRFLTDTAVSTLKQVDVILLIVDEKLSGGPGDTYILNLLKQVKKTPKILVINKIDKIGPDEYLKIYNEYDAEGVFDQIVGTSALNGQNTDVVIDMIKPYIKEGPQYFPEDLYTDNPMKFLVSEIIREKALMYLNDEVPHGIAVEIERYAEKDGITDIDATIYCEKKSHKGIIIGAGGRKLKGIGKAARLEIEPLVGTKVYLQLWVKVKEHWRESDIMVSNFGYKRDDD
ncbi:MAG: GTPase Era [Anaerovoracaceae bacterium]|nr:GTPase Era [Anaerovoracaceae bacterium]